MVAKEEINEGVSMDNQINNLTWKEKTRCYLKKGIEKESVVILKIQQSIQTPLLTSIMRIATFTGNDNFYTMFMPMLFWCDISEYGLMKREFFRQINFLARNLVLSFAYSTFVTGFIKDFLSLPRPKSPPVIRKLKKSYVDYEFGCPSTHSANSCVLALNFLFFFLTFLKPIISTSHPLMIFIYSTTAVFIFSVSLSRIYFGMHSFLDIVIGIIIGTMITVINWFFISSLYESALFSSILGPIVQIVFHRFLLIFVHPDPEHYCPCFEDSYSFFSFFDGIAIGAWLDKYFMGDNSSVKLYKIQHGVVKGLKNALKNEPLTYKNMSKVYFKYNILNKLYQTFGIKSILLIRYLLGLIILISYKKLSRNLILFIGNTIFHQDKNDNNSKINLNKLENENEDKNDSENEKNDKEDEDNLINHKKKYHLPRHSILFLSRNFEYIGLGIIIYANIHLFKYLSI